MFDFEISPRDALAAPKSQQQIYIQSIVIVTVSILSVLGAAWIMASFAAFQNLRSFRHQLILGLAISDCVMALNFLISSAMNVHGTLIGAPEQATFCSFNGYMTQIFVIQTDYWVLSIAICTYFILAGHKRASSWVQDHKKFLWALPWFFSILWASIGLGVTGYGDIGAWCWFTSDEVRLLVNFVPRWLIITIMFGLYAYLYFFLYKAHSRFMSFDESSGNPGSAANNLESGTRPRVLANDNSLSQGVDRYPSRSNVKLKKLARLMLCYPLAYAIIWTLPTSIRIYQTTTGRPAPFPLQTADKSCIVIQGFVDAIIYGMNETSLSSWRNLLFPRAFPTINGMNSNGDNAPPPDRSRTWSTHMSGKPIPSRRAGGPADSDNSLDMGGDTDSRTEMADKIEMGDLRHEPASMRITKTVEVDIRSSAATSQPAVPQRSYVGGGKSFYHD